MLSLPVMIGVIVAAAVGMLLIGIPSGIAIARRRHHQLMRKNGLTRGLSTYHRAHLSIDSRNYAHVPQPRTQLRRSVQVPYGVISEGWAPIPSQENLHPQRMSVIPEQPEIDPVIPQHQRRRSLRQSFSTHSFSIPKTRRQKKIAKAIPLKCMPQSPLSAITEISGTTTSDRSPAMGIIELPTEITPRTTPERDDQPPGAGRPSSTQWPLQVTKTRSQETVPSWKNTRNGTLLRMNSTGHSISPSVSRPSLGQRSISFASTISAVPDDPLPPLPSIAPNRYPQRHNSNLRLSADSIDTIGSSVLGGGMTTASEAETDFTSIALVSPSINLDPSGLLEYEPRTDSCVPSAVTMGEPPGKQTWGGCRNGKAAVGSLRASVGTHSLLRTRSTSHVSDQNERGCQIPRLTGSGLTTIDASNWNPALSSRGSSFRSGLSPSLPAPVASTSSSRASTSISVRHSMYEQHTGIGKLALNPAVLQDVSGNPASPVRRSRPASVASENPFQWDRMSLQDGLPSTLKSSPGSLHKGHKRQNCVRISNLPAVDTSRRSSKLPKMAEEDEEQIETPPSKRVRIPGLGLLEQDDGAAHLKAIPKNLQFPPSPFHNRPILEPTSRLRRPVALYSRSGSTEPSTPRSGPDSDVFGNPQFDHKVKNIFAKATINRQWSVSPTPQIPMLQPTPPTLKAIREPYSPNSPILPSPILSSANLFARAATNNRRKSGVLGPRNQPSPVRSLRTASPTPAVSRVQKKRSGDDLRRSVVALRRMNSDTKMKDRASKLYHNRGEEDTSASSSITSLKSPDPTTGHVSAALSSPSTMSLGLHSPSTTKQASSPNAAASWGVPGRSRMDVSHSPSMASQGETSIWEDASVRAESPEPEPPSSTIKDIIGTPRLTIDVEAYGNFVGSGRMNSMKDRQRESRLTSPQGKGLGLRIGSKAWGTPVSLYDRDGFLKE